MALTRQLLWLFALQVLFWVYTLLKCQAKFADIETSRPTLINQMSFMLAFSNYETIN